MTAREGRTVTSDDNDHAHPGNDWRPCPGTQPDSSRTGLPAPPATTMAGGRIQASHRDPAHNPHRPRRVARGVAGQPLRPGRRPAIPGHRLEQPYGACASAASCQRS